MKTLKSLIVSALAFSLSSAISLAEVKVAIAHNESEQATAAFRFKNVPSPSKGTAAAAADFTIIDGERDRNGADVSALHDSQLPASEDQPAANFFFRAGTDGGRILVDLKNGIAIKQINTYSWHAATRGPQVYVLYASDGKAEKFEAKPRKGSALEECGWKLIAKVDSRPQQGEPGGQYGVSISDSAGTIGTYRYLLFDISQTENADGFGNTFYSEICVIDRNGPEPVAIGVAVNPQCVEVVEVEGGYRITLDTTDTPDLTDWARKELLPMAREWYPKIVKLLPSEGYEAPREFSITFKEREGVAETGGRRITCMAKWFRGNLKGEAVGAVFHEMVHVVQQYGRARRNPNATRAPGWLTEGIADYVRWFQYEPQTHGAEITKRNIGRAKYDSSYRITANFMNWVSEKYDKQLVPALNAAIRDGKYNEELWKTRTGHSVQELGEEWKSVMEKKVGAEAPASEAAK